MSKVLSEKKDSAFSGGPAKVIAIANHKGGVGKTTTTLTVGSLMAKKGYRVLLFDLDPQSNLTLSLIREDVEYKSIYDFIKSNRKDLPIVKVKENLDLVPSSLNLTQLELSLMGILQREYIIRNMLKPYLDEYDFIFIDCPPALGIFTVNALATSDYVLIPMTAEVLPYNGLTSLITLIAQISDGLNTRLSVLGIVFVKYKANLNLTKEIETAVTSVYGSLLMDTKVHDTIKAAEAPLERIPLVEYAPKSPVVKDYGDLAEEMLKRMSLKDGGDGN